MAQSLVQKIIEIRKTLDMEKTGVLPKDKGGKPYWVEEHVTAEIRKHFDQHNILIQGKTIDAEYIVPPRTDDPNSRYNATAKIVVQYTITDGDTGEELEYVVAGGGSDIGGDSAFPKAYTQARKSLWKEMFYLSERGDDADFESGEQNITIAPAEATKTMTALQGALTNAATDEKIQKQLILEATKLYQQSRKLPNDHPVSRDDWWTNIEILEALNKKFVKSDE